MANVLVTDQWAAGEPVAACGARLLGLQDAEDQDALLVRPRTASAKLGGVEAEASARAPRGLRKCESVLRSTR